MALLTNYDEKFKIPHFCQEGFRPHKNTTRQIQRINIALEDPKLANNNIFLTFIDFRNVFGPINHVRLLALMKDLGYPKDVVSVTPTQIPPPIKMNIGMIQD